MKPVSDNVLLVVTGAVSAWVVCASGYLYSINLGRSWPDLLPVAVMCVAWIARQSARGATGLAPGARAPRRKLTQAILIGALLMGVPLLARMGWTDALGPEFDRRSSGFMMGVMLMFVSNAIPKQASSARGLALRRLAGWSFVLGGAGYALAFLVLPLAYANTAALWILLFALTYAAVHIAWSIFKQRFSPDRSG